MPWMWPSTKYHSTVVLCSGDGAGSMEGEGFFTKLKKRKRSGWNVEVLAWQGCCNRYMKQWVQENGFYVPLDDFYWSIKYLESDPNPKGVKPYYRLAHDLDLLRRPGYAPIPPTVEDWDTDDTHWISPIQRILQIWLTTSYMEKLCTKNVSLYTSRHSYP